MFLRSHYKEEKERFHFEHYEYIDKISNIINTYMHLHNISFIRLYHDKRMRMIVEFFYVEYVFKSKI